MVDLKEEELVRIEQEDYVFESDNVHISAKEYPVLCKKLKSLQQGFVQIKLTQAQSIQLMYEARHWLSKMIDEMQLASKDIFFVIGPSRTGKGTLLQALKGTKIEFINKRKFSSIKFVFSSEVSNFMSPMVDGVPVEQQLISHGRNSHTLKPKLASDPPQYADEYCGLDKMHAIDFPGMFESRGPELDVALYLAIQQILLTARSAKILILVSAQVFEPESSKILSLIIEKLNIMFKEPEKHLVVGIVKTRMVNQTLGDREEIMSVALGKNNEAYSFKGYQCIFVEQDQLSDLQNMVKIIQQSHCIKPFVKKGFICYHELIKIFEEQMKPLQQKEQVLAAQIGSLVSSLESKIPKPQKSFDQMVQEIADTLSLSDFKQEQSQLILKNLKQLLVYQKLLKDQWDSIGNPQKIKSILGLVPEYSSIELLLDDNKFHNPVVTAVLHELDVDLSQNLKQCLLILRKQYFVELRDQIQICEGFVTKQKLQTLKNECNRIENTFKEELQIYGISEIEQESFLRQVLKVIIVPFRIIGYVGFGLKVLFKSIKNKIVSNKNKQKFTEFKQTVDMILYDFILTDLQACENILFSVGQRWTRLRTIVNNLRKLENQTQDDLVQEQQQLVQQILIDKLEIGSVNDFQQKYLAVERGEKVIFSIQAQKINRNSQKRPIQIVITNFGNIIIVAPQLENRWTTNVSQLKSIIWVIEENTEQNISSDDNQLIINPKNSFDYLINLLTPESKDDTLKAFKLIYWMLYRVNLRVYKLSRQDTATYQYTKLAFSKQLLRMDIPEKFRVVEQSDYFEDPYNSQFFSLYSQQNQIRRDAISSVHTEQLDMSEQNPSSQASDVQNNDIANQIFAQPGIAPIRHNNQADQMGEQDHPEEVQRNVEVNIFDLIEQQQNINANEFSGQPANQDQFDILQQLQFEQEKKQSKKQNKQNNKQSAIKKKDEVTLEDFEKIKLIGAGTCAKVFLVRQHQTNDYFAMKELRKDFLVDNHLVESTLIEKQIMQQTESSFICKLVHCFTTDIKVFFIMNFYRAGTLQIHAIQSKYFSEQRVKIYAVQIALAIGNLHKKRIIYRDLKLDNILVDEAGYVALSDFGISKKLAEVEDRTSSFCGTPLYMAPEMFQGQQVGYSFTVDWWALGIVVYEMLIGYPPFYECSNNNIKLFKKITEKQVSFPNQEQHGINLSTECKDFIKELLEKDPKNRLGFQRDMDEVLEHIWFKDIDIKKVEDRTIALPDNEKPQLELDQIDLRYFTQQFTENDLKKSLISKRQRKKVAEAAQLFEQFDEK